MQNQFLSITIQNSEPRFLVCIVLRSN
uniref:Uncharacterized protein n=1 Tax=Arundo donax TaxID=35708 RepID=A0A0A9GKG7_ARUDO